MQLITLHGLRDQLRYLTTKILGGDSYSLFSTGKVQKFLVFFTHTIPDIPNLAG
jgi:hypothetical protein